MTEPDAWIIEDGEDSAKSLEWPAFMMTHRNRLQDTEKQALYGLGTLEELAQEVMDDGQIHPSVELEELLYRLKNRDKAGTNEDGDAELEE